MKADELAHWFEEPSPAPFADGLIPLEVWISEDGYMVRVIMEIDGSGSDVHPTNNLTASRLVTTSSTPTATWWLKLPRRRK